MQSIGTVVSAEEEKLVGLGRDLRDEKPRKEDILQS